MAGIDGLNPGDCGSEQMRALFGAGLHPLAEQRQQQLQGPSLTVRDYQSVTRLGRRSRSTSRTCRRSGSRWRRIAALNQAAGLPADWVVPRGSGPDPHRGGAGVLHRRARPAAADARELAAAIAKHSRPRTQAVAGYDLTFSPVKSVSALWAVADQVDGSGDRRAHQAAVGGALRFIEQRATLQPHRGQRGPSGCTRDGGGRVHPPGQPRRRPDLHTHVAVANKVQTLDGRWLSIDGRILFKATVAASETYNTALENHLRAASGSGSPNGPTPIHGCGRSEKSSIDRLNARWSAAAPPSRPAAANSPPTSNVSTADHPPR